jgi:hypothetical protein
MIPGVNYNDPHYEINQEHRWLARIAVENFPTVNPDTDEGRDELISYALAIFRTNNAIQHIWIVQAGEVVGEAYRGIDGVEGARLQ